MKESAAREGILRFFPEPPSYAAEDLGVLLRLGGRNYFLEAARVVEITGRLAVSRLPGNRARGVSFWRGRAHEVVGNSAEAARGFVLVRGGHGDFFIASEVSPLAVSRRELSEKFEDYPEEG